MDEGLVSSRERAQELIRENQVWVNGSRVTKNSLAVSREDKVDLRSGESKWVSRGARKLEKALDHWSLRIQDKKCLDVGACTGGFSQVLLERGAKKVYALDGGQGQLATKLKSDDRVINLEKVNARDIPDHFIPEKLDFICLDVSYISLTLVLPEAVKFLAAGGEVVALIKPQFEVGRGKVKKGLVTREEDHLKARKKVKEAGGSIGLEDRGIIESPILGAKGNKEFLIHFQYKL